MSIPNTVEQVLPRFPLPLIPAVAGAIAGALVYFLGNAGPIQAGLVGASAFCAAWVICDLVQLRAMAAELRTENLTLDAADGEAGWGSTAWYCCRASYGSDFLPNTQTIRMSISWGRKRLFQSWAQRHTLSLTVAFLLPLVGLAVGWERIYAERALVPSGEVFQDLLMAWISSSGIILAVVISLLMANNLFARWESLVLRATGEAGLDANDDTADVQDEDPAAAHAPAVGQNWQDAFDDDA